MLPFIFVIVALVLLILQAFNCPGPARFTYGWAGLAFWLASTVITKI